MFTEEQKEQVLNLAQNFTSLQISKQLNINVADIYGFLKRQGITPLTEGDIIMNRIYKEAAKYSKEEMKLRLGISDGTFEKYVKETGVVFKVPKNAPQAVKSFSDIRKMNELMEGIKECYEPKGQPHIKEAYTQSGSPYGIADELR
jgi:hypothetical protein